MAKPSNGFWPDMHENAFFATALLVVLILLGTLFASLTVKTLIETQNIGVAQKSERSITVDGSSTVSVLPDMATVSIGVEVSADTVAQAQSQSAAKVNTIVNALMASGIPSADIQTTNYSVYEDTVYNPSTGDYDSKGWITSQFIDVDIRDTNLVSTVLDIAGTNGATNIYGPNYSIDDSSVSKQQARGEAIAQARERAVEIARSLGVNLGDVISYYEYSDNYDPYPYYGSMYDSSGGSGSGLEPGSEEVTLNVTLTIELVQ